MDRTDEAHPGSAEGFARAAALAPARAAASAPGRSTAAELLAFPAPIDADVATATVAEPPRELAPAVWKTAPRPPRRTRRNLWLTAQAMGFGFLIYLCLFNLSVVRGSSMTPHIHDGDRILIDHFSYLFGPVSRGDIVVLKYPLDPSVDYIKRVIGLPGDDVVLEDGHVAVNGVKLDEPYIADQDELARVHVHVKPAHFFVLGDNRPRSCDSREFGLVPQDYVRGKVEVRVWPPDRIGRVDA